jgi:hypothetical protein
MNAGLGSAEAEPWSDVEGAVSTESESLLLLKGLAAAAVAAAAAGNPIAAAPG